jgi:D-serine deaminase-like pyridoxal phosphate-dependent protein
MYKDDLDTPALLLDLDRLENNIDRMAKFTKECDVDLRPHAKTHKIPDLAKMQISAGSKGVCLQKLSEAEVFASAGIRDIFITNEIVAAQKHERLAELAGKIHVGVAADDPDVVLSMGRAVREAGSELDVYVDVDCGMGRTGVSAEDAAGIAEVISREKNLVFKGIMSYEGHVGSGKSREERVKLAEESMRVVARAKKGIEKKGMNVDVVSVGSSVSTWVVARDPVVTEVQPGMYVFNDTGLVDKEVANVDDCALTVLATVMSKPAIDRAVVDAGSKAFQWDQGKFPRAFDAEGVEMVKFSEEHGWLRLAVGGKQLTVGDRLQFIPVHCCTCVNQHDEMIGLRKSKVERIWPILARGKMK